ncbi:MAG TPA: hypothetical protein VMH83_00645, partial [Candidatus Acidoferrum sp.]|nr:hypothetical protein [Candidatus Acidoferrum sp.]
PFSLLKALKPVLKPGGTVYVSLPNVANVAVRLKLLVGRFEYEEAGIMDMTHLRFFTIATARQMVQEAGFRIVRETYSNWNWSLLPRGLLRALRLRRVEQWIRNGLTRLLPGLCATQIMLVAVRD